MLAKAQEYNQVMKDIPLSELLAASDLEALRIAIGNVFLSIKKFRNTKYPLNNSWKFFMTISTDCCEQMIQVYIL